MFLLVLFLQKISFSIMRLLRIDSSKAVLLLWFYLLYELESDFCYLNMVYVFIVLVKFG